jgi:hypothetical protein
MQCSPPISHLPIVNMTIERRLRVPSSPQPSSGGKTGVSTVCSFRRCCTRPYHFILTRCIAIFPQNIPLPALQRKISRLLIWNVQYNTFTVCWNFKSNLLYSVACEADKILGLFQFYNKLYKIVLWAIITQMMEAVSTSKTSINVYQTTRCNIPEDSHPHTRRCENLKSHQGASNVYFLYCSVICHTLAIFLLSQLVQQMQEHSGNLIISLCIFSVDSYVARYKL